MDIGKLISLFSKLPSLGPASSRRIVLHLLRNKRDVMMPLANGIKELGEQTKECEVCFNLDTTSPCAICADASRDKSLLCVVEELGDLWAFEKGRIYTGMYHVLGGALSALSGIGPEDLNLGSLPSRVRQQGVKEVIVATGNDMDGQVTCHYIAESVKGLDVKVTRLACGIPLGGEIDYLDEGTLQAALASRYTI
ncbi:recombination mediator RecR [Candidatus Anaplasma sp. TIGMIC]|uniref:recombination mediator RecR n=1 Tax=Candidatus Anaplasma sp. TIGMIC TaxID=3020713 RepID=UPI00232C41C3|nr:recombination mediator RecR [Candidatus Anaplasma sp. TIGMIC]MDB1135107.1 recombination mediator RecR [Candidatus Anaplasma sp. TIGMIC]